MPPQTVINAASLAVKKTTASIPTTANRRSAKRSAATIFTVSQLLERYRDPRAILLEMAGSSLDAIVEATGCTRLEAWQEKRLCAMAALPYVSQKLPVQVDMRHTRAIVLNMLDKDEYTALEQVAFADPNKAHDIEATIVQAIAEDHASDTPADDLHDTVSQAVNGDDGG